jgi:hypothetical protein
LGFELADVSVDQKGNITHINSFIKSAERTGGVMEDLAEDIEDA